MKNFIATYSNNTKAVICTTNINEARAIATVHSWNVSDEITTVKVKRIPSHITKINGYYIGIPKSDGKTRVLFLGN